MTRPPTTDIFYRRQLPHWQPAGATIFITWRLYGSLPKQALDRLADEKRRLEKQPIRPDETPRDRALRHSKGLFALTEKMLADTISGPHWLQDEQIGQLVVNALFHHDSNLYTLLAFVVMPNHVHVLLSPLAEKKEEQTNQLAQATEPDLENESPSYVLLRRITQSLKGYTAREANRVLGRTGQTFWQVESYDHWVRDEAEFERAVSYIEWDPVKSGLVVKPEEWRWSSAWERAWGRCRKS
jgi:REP element-mobilizing transposase RayT